MEVECLAVAGTWKYKDNGHWDFVFDQARMSREVHFDKGANLDQLTDIVCHGFKETNNLVTVSLSYLSPELNQVVNGKQTPPVVLSTDSSLRTFCRHLMSGKLNILYVSFINTENQTTYATPGSGMKRKSITNDVGSSSDQCVTEDCFMSNDFFVAVDAIENTMLSSSKASAPTHPMISTPASTPMIFETPVKHSRFVGTPIKQPRFDTTPVPRTHGLVDIPVTHAPLPLTPRLVDTPVADAPIPRTPRLIASHVTHAPIPRLVAPPVNHVTLPLTPRVVTTPVTHGPIPQSPRLVDIPVNHVVVADTHVSHISISHTPTTQPRITDTPSTHGTLNTNSSHPIGNFCDEEENSDSSLDSYDIEDIEVGSRGYDEDFWGPLLDDTFGGSNAPDIMLGEKVNFNPELVSCAGNLTDEMHDVPISQYNLLKHGPSKDNLGWCITEAGESSKSMPKSAMLNCGQEFKSTHVNPGQSTESGLLNHGQTSASARLNRVQGPALSATSDDNNDLPPMFDDTQYANFMIPDLDLDEGDETIVEGRLFANKTECQIALAIYAIRNMFHFLQRRTTKDFFVVTCSDQTCGWRVSAHRIKENVYYVIKKASLIHSCGIDTRSKFTKMVTAKVIAHVFKSKFGVADSGPKAKDLQRLVLEELRVSTSYSKCWRANQVANEEVRGTEEESYLHLEEYLYMLNLANPGSRTAMKTVIDPEGVERFLYLFLAFGASITGFKELRHVLVLDGTHLSGKYKGVLLTASGQDANFQVFPLAFAIVDSENDASWNWFLTNVEAIIADSPSLTIISDRHQSIKKATKSVFKSAKHGACIVHLARNVITKFKNKGLANDVMKAACAYQIKHFKKVFDNIRKTSPRCAKFLEKVGLKHWARAYFPGNRYNLMTSNIAETLNNALRGARRSTIIELLTFIQSMLIRWFCKRREKSIAHKESTTPEVDKLIQNTLAATRGSKVTSVSNWSCEVQGLFGERHFVQLSEKKCTCKVYDELKIPCGHALLAAENSKFQYGQLVGDKYRTSVWAKTYACVIKPNEDPGNHDIPEAIRNRSIQPPKVKRPCGRPKVNRYLSTGEIPIGRKQKKCGRCGGMGHNKISCKNPI